MQRASALALSQPGSTPALPFLPTSGFLCLSCWGSMGGAPFQAWGWDGPGRSSHQGLTPSCRFLLGPSRAWDPSSRACTCRRTSCRLCPRCPVSASWSLLTLVAIPSIVTASCSRFTGEHPHSPPTPAPARVPPAAVKPPPSPQGTTSAPTEHLWQGRVLPGPATLLGGARHLQGLGWPSLSLSSPIHKVGMKSTQPSGAGPRNCVETLYVIS